MHMRKLYLVLLLAFCATEMRAAVLVPPVLVLSPENRTGKAEYNWIGLSISRYLTEKLLPLLNVAIVNPESRAAGFESIQIPEGRAISHATMIRLASELKALYVFFGSYELTSDGNLQVAIIPFDASKNAIQRATVVKGGLSEIISLENTIGYSLVREYFADPESLRAQILGRDSNVPLEAYEYLVKSLAQADSQRRLQYLDKALAKYPEYTEARFEKAKTLYAKKDFAGVIKQLSASPSAEYADRFNFLQGMAYQSLGDPIRAAAVFSGLVGKPTLSGAALNNLAVAVAAQGNTDLAAFYLQNAIQADRLDPNFRFNLGVVRMRAGAKDEALSAFAEASRMNPSDWQSQFLLADLLAKSGRADESKTVRELALTYAPQRPPELKDLAVLRLVPIPQGGPAAAEPLPPAASRDEVVRFHLNRGTDFCRRGMWLEATSELKRVLYLNPYNGEARYLLASAYLNLGDLDHAVVEAKMSLWNNETAAAHALLARILSRLGRAAESRQEAERALELDPSNAEARSLLSGVQSSRGGALRPVGSRDDAAA